MAMGDNFFKQFPNQIQRSKPEHVDTIFVHFNTAESELVLLGQGGGVS